MLPVALTLVVVGVAGFINAYSKMFAQWETNGLFSLERAAHAVEMRLSHPIDIVKLIGNLNVTGVKRTENWVAELKKIPGVVRVQINFLPDSKAKRLPMSGDEHSRLMESGSHQHKQMMQHWLQGASVTKIQGPDFDVGVGGNTVTLIFGLKDENQNKKGQILLGLSFDYLVQDLQVMNWWRTNTVYLINDQGQVLVGGKEHEHEHPRLGQTGNLAEKRTLDALRQMPKGTLFGPGFPAEWVSGWFRMKRVPWTLVTFSTGRKVMGPIVGFVLYFILLGLLCILIVLILIRLVTANVSKSVRQVSDAAMEVSQGSYVYVPTPDGKDEVARLSESFNLMVDGLKERDFIRHTFSRYVDKDVVDNLLANPETLKLGGERRPVVVMMTDIRGFTPLSEKLGPEETIKFVNNYFTQIIGVTHKHKGIIVDFLGDAILAFFDTLDESLSMAAKRGVCCASEIQSTTTRFNDESAQKEMPPLIAVVGLHAGDVVVGNIGSETRTKYGIVGGAVNVTQRIQSEARGGEIVCSEALFRLVKDEVGYSRKFTASLKGVAEKYELYALHSVRVECNKLG